MNALEYLIGKIKTIPYQEIGMEALRENMSIAVDLNLEQLKNGLLADGSVITPSYQSPGYATLKNSMNSLPGMGTPDLNFTGQFYSHIDAKMTSTGILLYSLDVKTGTLTAKYGPFIIGLSVESKRELQNYFRPLVVEGIQKHFAR